VRATAQHRQERAGVSPLFDMRMFHECNTVRQPAIAARHANIARLVQALRVELKEVERTSSTLTAQLEQETSATSLGKESSTSTCDAAVQAQCAQDADAQIAKLQQENAKLAQDLYARYAEIKHTVDLIMRLAWSMPAEPMPLHSSMQCQPRHGKLLCHAQQTCWMREALPACPCQGAGRCACRFALRKMLLPVNKVSRGASSARGT
jgi:hypothetical protein